MLLPGLKRASARGQIEARDFSSSRCLLRRAGGRPADAWDCPHGVHRASGLDNLIRANTLSPPIHLSIHLCMDVRPQGVITPLFGRRGAAVWSRGSHWPLVLPAPPISGGQISSLWPAGIPFRESLDVVERGRSLNPILKAITRVGSAGSRIYSWHP